MLQEMWVQIDVADPQDGEQSRDRHNDPHRCRVAPKYINHEQNGGPHTSPASQRWKDLSPAAERSVFNSCSVDDREYDQECQTGETCDLVQVPKELHERGHHCRQSDKTNRHAPAGPSCQLRRELAVLRHSLCQTSRSEDGRVDCGRCRKHGGHEDGHEAGTNSDSLAAPELSLTALMPMATGP